MSGRTVSFKDITKGSSNTLLAGEKYVDYTIADTQSDCNDDQGWTDGWDNDTICFAYDAAGNISPPRRDGTVGTCGLSFGTIHQVLPALLCDGSVRPRST